MPGLLSPPRACLRGHGPMELAPDLYGLPQLATYNSGLMNSDRNAVPQIVSTGKILTVRVYTCAVCGLVEIVDSDKAP